MTSELQVFYEWNILNASRYYQTHHHIYAFDTRLFLWGWIRFLNKFSQYKLKRYSKDGWFHIRFQLCWDFFFSSCSKAFLAEKMSSLFLGYIVSQFTPICMPFSINRDQKERNTLVAYSLETTSTEQFLKVSQEFRAPSHVFEGFECIVLILEISDSINWLATIPIAYTFLPVGKCFADVFIIFLGIYYVLGYLHVIWCH